MARHHFGHRHYGGWQPSLPDHRDLVADTTTLPMLPEVDPRDAMPMVYNQSQLGSCTANAVAAALEYDRILDGDDTTLAVPSRLFIYYCERLIEGSLGQGDTGAMGRDGFKAAARYGTPPEKEWPYKIHSYQTDPPSPVWTDALAYRLTKPYKAVTRSTGPFKQVLSNQQTIAFGFSVYESFESDAVAATGIVPMPLQSEKQLGGHEVLMVGYLESHPGYFLVRNSWGADWGIAGYFLMPTAYLMNTGLASDFRTIVRQVAA